MPLNFSVVRLRPLGIVIQRVREDTVFPGDHDAACLPSLAQILAPGLSSFSEPPLI